MQKCCTVSPHQFGPHKFNSNIKILLSYKKPEFADDVFEQLTGHAVLTLEGGCLVSYWLTHFGQEGWMG